MAKGGGCSGVTGVDRAVVDGVTTHCDCRRRKNIDHTREVDGARWKHAGGSVTSTGRGRGT